MYRRTSLYAKDMYVGLEYNELANEKTKEDFELEVEITGKKTAYKEVTLSFVSSSRDDSDGNKRLT